MGERTHRTVLIGNGNVATHLGAALEAAGHDVVRAGGRVRTLPIPKDAELYIIAVTDSVIAQVASEIGEVDGVVVHTAGSVPMTVLPQKRRGVLYPLQTFSKDRKIDMAKVPFFVESDTDLDLLKEVASSLSGTVYEMDSEKRKHLHLAAVFCCNFTNRLYAMAAELVGRQGIPFEALLPLIDETAAKVHELHPRQAQTGPAVRWNVEVMEAQKAMLEDGTYRQIYELMSKSIHDDKL